MLCMNCKEQEVLKRYYTYDGKDIYEISLCWTCDHKFRQELIKDHNTIDVMKRFGARTRPIGKNERLAPPAYVLHVDYVGYKR